MFKEFYGNKDDDYLSEFRQKIATERQAELQARKQELQRSRNGFIGTIAGIALAGIVSWVLLIPRFNEDKNVEIPVIRRPINPVKIHPSNPQGIQIQNQDKSIYALVEKQEAETVKIESILPAPEKPKLPEIVPEPEVKHEPEIIEEETVQEKQDILPIKNLEELIENVETTEAKKIEIPQKPNIKIEPKTVEPTKTQEVDKKEITTTEIKKSEPIKETIPTGNWQIQLMASSNIDAINKGWIDLSKKHKSLQNLSHNIESITTDKGSSIYRLKTGNFNSKEEADKFCNNLKKEGLNCITKQK
jgi:septal ring-binding cell division protein DamX